VEPTGRQSFIQSAVSEIFSLLDSPVDQCRSLELHFALANRFYWSKGGKYVSPENVLRLARQNFPRELDEWLTGPNAVKRAEQLFISSPRFVGSVLEFAQYFKLGESDMITLASRYETHVHCNSLNRCQRELFALLTELEPCGMECKDRMWTQIETNYLDFNAPLAIDRDYLNSLPPDSLSSLRRMFLTAYGQITPDHKALASIRMIIDLLPTPSFFPYLEIQMNHWETQQDGQLYYLMPAKLSALHELYFRLYESNLQGTMELQGNLFNNGGITDEFIDTVLKKELADHFLVRSRALEALMRLEGIPQSYATELIKRGPPLRCSNLVDCCKKFRSHHDSIMFNFKESLRKRAMRFRERHITMVIGFLEQFDMLDKNPTSNRSLLKVLQRSLEIIEVLVRALDLEKIAIQRMTEGNGYLSP